MTFNSRDFFMEEPGKSDFVEKESSVRDTVK